jgi:hypothetical protein
MGRAEYFNITTFEWGTICDDGWTNINSRVFCRSLGLNSNSVDYTSYSINSSPLN